MTRRSETQVTYATMHHTNGTWTRYHIYRGILVSTTRERYIDLHMPQTKLLASIDIGPGWTRVPYLAMARQHETPEWPAFAWTED